MVPTVTFGVLCDFFIIDHARRKIRDVNVTAHPGAEWVIRRLREAFPFDETLGRGCTFGNAQASRTACQHGWNRRSDKPCAPAHVSFGPWVSSSCRSASQTGEIPRCEPVGPVADLVSVCSSLG